jgi:uncharacterized protein (TIGR02466 family)
MSLDVDVYPLFSTPLFKTNLKRSDDDILNFAKNHKFRYFDDIKNGLVSESVYILNEPELKNLSEDIQNNINFFAHKILGVNKSIEFFVTNSWIMKHERGHWAQEHYHTNSLITGIYYFDVKKDSGDITFTKNKILTTIFPSLFEFVYDEETIFNKTNIKVTPVNGDLLLFPSHMLHSVDDNRNMKERYCLAFNVFIRGTLGSDVHFSRLDFK